MAGGLFIGLGNAFLAVSAFVLALFAMFGAICLLLRLYLGFEGFVADCWAEHEGQRPALPRDGVPDGDQFPTIFHSAPLPDERR